MISGQTPAWLRFLERRCSWLAIPNIAVLFVTLQGLGYLMVMSDPIWVERLALFPDRVLQGEFWRLVTFLALPVSLSPLWVLFALWFLYFILQSIEATWGAFKTTFYILFSILVTIAYSFAFQYPITQVTDFESTLFLAAAALFPESQISLFMILPVKMKWLAWLTLALLLIRLFQADWIERGYILAIYSSYLLFFGPAALERIKQFIRRERFRRKMHF